MTFNIERHNAIIAQIEAHPETWDQYSWHCETTHCYAGWAQILSGKEPISPTARKDARIWLNLSWKEANLAFASHNTLEFLKILPELFIYTDGYNRAGYDRDGYNRDGYDRAGYDRDGYNRDGYDRAGYNCDGYNRAGYNCDGYDRDGYNRDGYDRDGYDRDGYDRDGYDRDGFDRYGFDRYGYDRDVFDRYGYDPDGLDKHNCSVTSL